MAKHYDHDVLLRWRTALTDFEVDTFIPLFKGRLDGFEEIFTKMLSTLREAEKDVVYIASIEKIVNPNSLPTSQNHVPVARAYCQEVERIIQDFLRRVSDVRSMLNLAQDFRRFSKSMSLMDQLCQSIIQNKVNLFLFNIRPYAHAIDHKTKSILTTQPVEYEMILRPFDLWLHNLEQIAIGTSGTIESWRKTQLDWKTQYLAFRSNESDARKNSIVLGVNIATVVLAVALSTLFLFLPDYVNSRKELSDLRARFAAQKSNLDQANEQMLRISTEKAKQH